jgi:hypothetical protein
MGDRCFGARGALAAAAGLMVFPSVVVLALAAFLFNMLDVPMVQGMLRGMGAVSAGLIAGTALKLTSGLRGHAFGAAGCLAIELGHALVRRDTLGYSQTMVTISSDHIVVVANSRNTARGNSLLADVEVTKTTNLLHAV